ncbi:MAG TPA: RNA polymerase sigma factor [Blastocatellia bacterium]|jgi:RNA polymerase sigma-70 factor (ECF subfamily)|nr:RNA polymerase sigma factor [Blastocatellia bacterium]
MEKTSDKFDFAMAGPGSDDERSDESLAANASSGDEAAFERLFERHRRRVARIAGRFFNRSERVEEVVQDVFTKVYFALDDYSAERGPSFAAWLSRIAINSCYDHLRRIRRRAESSFTEEDGALVGARLGGRARNNDMETAVITRDLAQKLLARLSPDDRMVLTLLDAQEMSVSDIAELTGWSVSKVKVRAHRARLALRRVLIEFL